MTNEFILTNYITNYITNYTEITNCGLNNNTIYNLVKTPNSNAITISLTISVIAVIVVLISYIIILTRNCICNKENIFIKEIKRQNKIIKYLYIIQYDFMPYIKEINNLYYNFKFKIDNNIITIFDIDNCFNKYKECITNIEANLEIIKEDIHKTYNMYAKNLKNINKTLNEIYSKTILIEYKSTSLRNIAPEFVLSKYGIFIEYFELVKKYINTIILSINMEVNSGIINKVDYNEIEDKEKEIIEIIDKYTKKE